MQNRQRGSEERCRSLTLRRDELAAQLASRVPAEVAERAAVAWDGEHWTVPCWGRVYRVRGADGVVAGRSDAPDLRLQMLILYYLVRADGTPPGSEWVSLAELPGGMFYRQAFQAYSGDALAQVAGNRQSELEAAARALGGEPVSFGDAAWVFSPLPRVRLLCIYWRGDDEFPARARVLFDRAAGRYLPTDVLAVEGHQLCARLAWTAGWDDSALRPRLGLLGEDDPAAP